MGKILSFQADTQTANLIEKDRADLGAALGMPGPLSMSQYLRHVITERLRSDQRGASPGWSEGFKAAYADTQKKIAAALNEK